MKRLSQLFFQGLFAILPVALTFFILFWLGGIAESTLGKVIKWLLPDNWYLPGMGLLAGFVFVLIIGILLNAYIFRKLGSFFNNIFTHIPLVKSIYNSVRDLAKFASVSNGEGDQDLQKAVLVHIDENTQLVGFITCNSLPFGETDGRIAVYLPMSYQLGGYTIIVPESAVEKLDLSVQDAMQFVLTAGVTKAEQDNHQ